MTKWEKFYRLIGGLGPDDREREKDRRGLRLDFASRVAYCLKRLGFIARNPEVKSWDQAYYINWKWQWKFWRGPYRDVIEHAARAGEVWAQFASPWHNDISPDERREALRGAAARVEKRLSR